VDQANIESPAEKRLRSKQLLQATTVESEAEEDGLQEDANTQPDDNMISEWLNLDPADKDNQAALESQFEGVAALAQETSGMEIDNVAEHPSLPAQVLQATARAVRDASTMTDSLVGVQSEQVIDVPEGEADAGSQEVTDTSPTVLEISKSLAVANTKLRSSTLLTDTDLKMEISIFLEAPEYYAISGRALTMKPVWELELEQEGDGSSWHIIIKPLDTEWYLEKRQKPKPPLGGSGKSTNSVRLYTRLVTHVADALYL